MSITLTETEPKLLPGDLAIWFFIFMELLVFGLFCISYAVTRLLNIELFNQYQLKNKFLYVVKLEFLYNILKIRL